MELVWLVYIISLIEPISRAAILGLTMCGALATISHVVSIVEEFSVGVYTWICTVIAIFSMFIVIFLPSEKTAYTMVAAYATQKIVEAPETKEIAKDVLTIINSKVKQYAVESVEELEKVKNK